MSSEKLSQFVDQKYLSLETYRKTGAPVQTPVWYAQESNALYIYSLANAGKVKRIRNNPRVRVALCDIRGKLKGEWVDGEARILDRQGEDKAHRLLNKKYGLVKQLGDFFSRLRKRERVAIAIEVR